MKNKSPFKIATTLRACGVVDCKSCLKPRCIYSLFVVSQMKPSSPHVIQSNHDQIAPIVSKEETQNYRDLAKDKLRDAMESIIFVCGMAPMYSDDPMYEIVLCDPSLDCNTHIDADFYTARIRHGRIELCCHCAGEFNSSELSSNNL